jgi:ATP-dependent DNA helicase RecG
VEYPDWADHNLSAELPILRARGENQELEYIEGFPENVRELAKEIAAFATSNQGTILVGVSDEGDLIGLREAGKSEGRDAFLRRLECICSGTVKPAITPTARFAVTA